NPAGTRLSRASASSVHANGDALVTGAVATAGSNFVLARSVSQPAPSLSRPTVSSIIGRATAQVMTGIFLLRAYFSTRAFARRRRYASVTSRRSEEHTSELQSR